MRENVFLRNKKSVPDQDTDIEMFYLRYITLPTWHDPNQVIQVEVFDASSQPFRAPWLFSLVYHPG